MNYINYIFQIFRDYSSLQWQGPKLKKKKKIGIWILAISDPSRVLCMGSEFPFRETTLGHVCISIVMCTINGITTDSQTFFLFSEIFIQNM